MPTGEKIRVMIVDDVSETRENVRKLLQFESDVDVVGAARTGKEAIQLSQDLNPDVVLMDINMPDMDGISATEAMWQPAVQVVTFCKASKLYATGCWPAQIFLPNRPWAMS
jgi:pilus assembly protein CpaE